jgi:hypothetical protein
MLKQSCFLCKVVGAIAIIGALNWGLVGIFNVNLVENFLGVGTMATKVVYGLVAASGIMLLISFFTVCPACKRKAV